MKKWMSIFVCIVYSMIAYGQNDRVSDYNNTNWFQTINNIRLNKTWSLHAEYQWRRTNGLKYWQQSLLRVGVNYKVNEFITTQLGYAWAETFPYGDIPIASSGTFPEHRIYEQVSFRQPFKKWSITHRFRIEQRWLGRVIPNTGSDRQVDGWNLLHRFRYQFRSVIPLVSRTTKQPYLVAADEIFISAGKNVGVNIFDQNRILLLLGYKFNDKISIEAGYFNQTLQQGRRVNNNTIIQRNNGVMVSSFLNL